MPGKLIVCPTPIGNLDDVTPRVRDGARRRRLRRLRGHAPHRPPLRAARHPTRPRLVSNHEQNETTARRQLAQQIERGARVALISDAGMPAISDPGYRLIRACIDRDLDVEVLPGPSAVPVALVASGLPTDRWRFEGYLPRRAGELERVLRSTETVVAFESPRRLPDSLAALAALAPDRPAAVCRELSKLHEEVTRGTLSELARRFRGEVSAARSCS